VLAIRSSKTIPIPGYSFTHLYTRTNHTPHTHTANRRSATCSCLPCVAICCARVHWCALCQYKAAPAPSTPTTTSRAYTADGDGPGAVHRQICAPHSTSLHSPIPSSPSRASCAVYKRRGRSRPAALDKRFTPHAAPPSAPIRPGMCGDEAGRPFRPRERAGSPHWCLVCNLRPSRAGRRVCVQLRPSRA